MTPILNQIKLAEMADVRRPTDNCQNTKTLSGGTRPSAPPISKTQKALNVANWQNSPETGKN